MAENNSKTFDRALWVMALFAVLTAVLAAVAAFRGGDTPASAAESPSDSGAVTANIELSEWAITGDLEVPAGDLTITLSNTGSMAHNLVFENGPRSPDVNAGETVTVEVGNLEPGSYTIFCDIPGHQAAGMEARLVVSGEVGEAEAGGEDTGGHGDMTPEQMDMVMIESMLAFPAETEGKGNEILEPTEIRADGTKVFDLTASVIEWEVAPGEFVDAWAYNGMVPGPWIKLDLGDSVEINVTNETELGTDVHWHGVSTPNDMDGVAPSTQDPILPGETFTYAFEAERPAIGMYHAHLHSQISVPNGMFAPFTIGETPIPYGETISGIEIPEDLEVAQEIPMVLNDAGVIGFSLNGKSFPATAPIVAQAGETVEIHYLNEGLQVHPMHLHGIRQLVIAKDGNALPQPYLSDTVLVGPGERYTVLVRPTAEEKGVWAYHCHILSHAEHENGMMFGMVTTFMVQ